MKHSLTSVFIYILFFLIGILLLLAIAFTTINTNEYVTITIVEGDTIWGIAQKYEENYHFSKQEFINWVEEKNSLYTGKIYPGDELIIPIQQHEIENIRTYAKE